MIDRDDLRQEYELERAQAAAEGRRPRPRAWVEADVYRRAHGRRAAGEPNRRLQGGDVERIAAPIPLRSELRASLVDRALRIAIGLPDEQRAPILMALRCLAPVAAEDRVRAWLEINRHRVATHAEIAADCALRRETVSRCIGRLRARRVH